jgi:hypothetical protein
VQKDLESLQHKMKADEIIAGDDRQPVSSHRQDGICRAVREFLKAAPCGPFCQELEVKPWAIRRVWV